MRQTLNTSSSVGLDAPVNHFLASVILGDEEAAFAGIAAIVIVRLAFRDDALIVLELEGLEAFLAGMIGLLNFTAEENVVSTFA